MIMKIFYKIFLIILFALPISLNAQEILNGGSVHGNFQVDAQYYQPDDKLGITDSSLNGDVYGMNAFGNIVYTNGRFSAGLRYEAYLPPLSGFDKRYKGQGIPYWYVNYNDENVELTVGHFYEQFGNGLVLRSYEEWALGFDNNINGARIRYKPFEGVYLKALAGTQRFFWEPFENNNRAIIKGLDGEFYLNDIFKGLSNAKARITLGGSFVSKYQEVEHEFIADTIYYKLKMPKNVAASAGRINFFLGGFNLAAEYAWKINDPSQMNNFIYKNGEALFLSTTYSQKGFGASFSFKRIDNMSFKSGIYEETSALDINYLPPLAKQHVYSLATIYPYATQPNGEIGYHANIIYNIPKGSLLGGKYGTKIEIDYSQINAIDKQRIDSTTLIGQQGTLGYTSDFFKFGQPDYFQDISFKISRKFGKNWKTIFSFVNLKYNIDIIEGHSGEPNVNANIGIADITYKINSRNSVRVEYQQLLTKEDRGDWMMGLIEYSIAPRWFFSVMDEYNYGNPDADMQIHYFTGAIAYNKDATRIAISYGRQREGLLCVGGVCRVVPASNGFTLSVTSSF